MKFFMPEDNTKEDAQLQMEGLDIEMAYDELGVANGPSTWENKVNDTLQIILRFLTS